MHTLLQIWDYIFQKIKIQCLNNNAFFWRWFCLLCSSFNWLRDNITRVLEWWHIHLYQGPGSFTRLRHFYIYDFVNLIYFIKFRFIFHYLNSIAKNLSCCNLWILSWWQTLSLCVSSENWRTLVCILKPQSHFSDWPCRTPWINT